MVETGADLGSIASFLLLPSFPVQFFSFVCSIFPYLRAVMTAGTWRSLIFKLKINPRFNFQCDLSADPHRQFRRLFSRVSLLYSLRKMTKIGQAILQGHLTDQTT